MEKNNYLEPKRLAKLQSEVWKIASAHGWHEEPISKEQYMGLIMTEVAEAVEADRKYMRARTGEFGTLMNCYPQDNMPPLIYDSWFEATYKNYIKGTIEEEFADVVIRILDMAQEVHGEKMKWLGYYPCGAVYKKDASFIENAWYFVKEVLNWGTMNISDSISFMFDWAEHLGIELWQHIEWKMKYNELRPYKHGGKKY